MMPDCQMCGGIRHTATHFNTEYALWVCPGAQAYLDGQYDDMIPYPYGATR